MKTQKKLIMPHIGSLLKTYYKASILLTILIIKNIKQNTELNINLTEKQNI